MGMLDENICGFLYKSSGLGAGHLNISFLEPTILLCSMK